MKTTRLFRSISVGTASLPFAVGTLVTDKPSNVAPEAAMHVHMGQPAGRTPDNLGATATVLVSRESRDFTVKYGLAIEWSGESAKRYHALVRKEAKATITDIETQELDQLQAAKRRAENPVPSAEMLARIRRERLDEELLQVLSKHVRLPPRPAEGAAT